MNKQRTILYESKNYELIIKEENLFDTKENKIVKTIINEYKIKEEEEKNILTQKYSENIIISFFYGRQFSYLFNLINNENYENIKYFIPFYFINSITSFKPNKKYIKENKIYNFKEQLEILSNYFKEIFEKNEINIKNLFDKNIIKNNINYDNKSIYIKSFFDDNYEYDCITLFYLLTGNLPLLSNILIYNEETLEEEILSFLFRVIKCNSKCLFVLIFLLEQNNSFINNNKIKSLFSMINEYINLKKNESIFLILFSDKNQKIILENIKGFKIFQNVENINENVLNEIKQLVSKNEISIICSDTCGAGKTEYIKNNIINNQKYIYFPLGGYLTRKYLEKRIEKEIIIEQNKENIIHIDLSDTNCEKVAKEFLFNFLIFKYYGYNDKIFNYNYNNAKIKIKIELPNTYINYFDKYQILKFIEIIKINIKTDNQNNILTLKEYKNLNCIKDSKIQTVSKVLSMFKDNIIEVLNPDLNSKDFIDVNECSHIINDYLIKNIQDLKKKDNYKPNYYQLKIFLDFLSSEFNKFIENFHLNPINFLDKEDEKNEKIINNVQILRGIIPKYFQTLRNKIIDSLIKNSIYFTFSPFDYIINEKNEDLSKIEYNKEKEYKFDSFIQELQDKMQDSIIDFDNINPSILAFHEEGILFSIISTNENDEKLNLINKHYSWVNSELKRYENFNSKNLISKVKTPKQLESENILLDELLKIITEDTHKINKIKYIFQDNKFINYVFTRDNFIKMFLLIMRIRAEIPTILMGETGCGKTHLIEMFSLLYRQYINNMYTLKFHSGITDQDIELFIQKTKEKNEAEESEEIEKLKKEFDEDYKNDKIQKDKEYKLKESEMKFWEKWFKKIEISEGYKKYDKKGIYEIIEKKIKNRKIIIFFDEINTCNSLGLVKQIMCDKNYRKINNIPDRFIIICACNPYRILNKENQKLQFGLNLRNSKKRRLVYTVNPLNFSLMNFVLDFKDLTQETTKKYIESIIGKMIGRNKYFEIIEKLVEKSHFFIKQKSDISGVSLREINRFGKIYNFFKQYLKNLENNKEKNIENNIENKDDEIIKKSIMLSLYFCYYLRIPTTKLRNEYLEEIKKIQELNYEEIFEEQSKFITDKILEGKRGYAKNKSLRENLFCEFICLLNKEPLIICGKPGASKSLSVTLLIDAMRGKNSENKFFQKYPEIIPSFYQCSITSTSESVEKVFQRARKKLQNYKENYNQNIISLVFMDEMGIADESKNNPLKVLHTELDNNLDLSDEKKICFCGISNWSLDASKMNRAINIVVEEPDIKHIEETAKEIARTINEDIEKQSEKLIISISKTYYYYISEYQPNQGKEDYHGFRDFYYLIKYIYYNINDEYQKKKNKIYFNIDDYLIYVIKGIIKNFGGIENSIEKMEKKFIEYYFGKEQIEEKSQKLHINYDVIDCIKENLNSKFENRYLLLIGNNEMNEYLLKCILKGEKYEIISDNNLKAYENENNGVLNLLLKIQLLMEKEIILILKNLEILYPSLYDLFNKNFSQYGNSNKFAKISFENKQSLLYVNDNFKIIILAEKDFINYEDKPFLNRFEKHILLIDNLLDKNILKIVNNIYESINNLIKVEKENEILYLDNFIINLSLNKLKIIVLEMVHKSLFSIDNLIKYLVPLFSQEFIFLINYKDIIINEYSLSSIINPIYKENEEKNNNLLSYLLNLSKDSFQNVIYTFSNKNNKLFKDNFEINNTSFSSKKTFVLNLEDNFEIGKFMDKIKENNYNLFIIEYEEKDIYNKKHLIEIKNIIDDYIKNNHKDKTFLFIIYRERIIKNVINNKKNIIIENNQDEEDFNIIKQNNCFKNEDKQIPDLFYLYNQQFINDLHSEYNNTNIQVLTENLNECFLINNKLEMENIIDQSFRQINLKIENEEGYNLENINKIKKSLKNNDNNALDLLKENLYKIIDKKNLFFVLLKDKEQKSNDFINIYTKKLRDEIIYLFTKLIYFLEDDLSLTSTLFSSLSNDKIENNFKSKLSEFNKEKDYMGIKYIFLGFNLPGIFKYYKKLNNINKEEKINLKEEILSIDDIKQILEKGNKEEIKYLYTDYLLYFISIVLGLKTSSKKRIEVINFLDKIIQICNIDNNLLNQNNFYIFYIEKIEINLSNLSKQLSEIISFLEFNKDFIKKIILIFIDFIEIIPDFIKNFISITINIKRNYYPNEINKDYYLFKVYESFIDTIIDESKFTYYFGEKKEKYINILNKNVQIMKTIDKKIYSLSTKNIEIFLEILNYNDKLLNWVLNFFEKERNIIINYNEANSNNSLIIDKIKEINKDDNNYFNSMINILIKQIQKKINNENEVSSFINLFLSNIRFIKYSLPFLDCILKPCLQKEKLYEQNNFDDFICFKSNLKYIHSKINEILSNSKNNILNEIILFYFECFYENYYFSKIVKSKEDDFKNILCENSLTLASNSCNYLSDNNSNNNLESLIRIAYIKQYLNYYTNIIYNCKNESSYGIFDEIIEKLNLGRESKKSFHIYILKLLYKLSNNDEERLKKFIFDCKIDYLSNNYYVKGNINSIIEIIKEHSPFKNFMLFSEYSSIKLLKYKFNKEEENKISYPLLNIVLNNPQIIELLQNIPSINAFSNKILNYLNYQKTKEEIKTLILSKEKENIIKYFLSNEYEYNNIIDNYVNSYNLLVKDKDKKLDNNDLSKYSLDFFIISNDKNELLEIYKSFIKYQNDLINILLKIDKNLLKNINEIYVQDATNEDIPKLCSEDELIEIIMNNSYKEYNFDKNSNIKYDDNYRNIIFNYAEIEKNLVNNICLGIKKFIESEIGIKKIIYKDETYTDINNDILIDFQKKYGKTKLEESEEKKIKNILENKDKKESFLLSLQFLMLNILSLSRELELKGKDYINDIIKKIPIANLDLTQKEFYNIITKFFEEENNNDDNDDDIFSQMNDNTNESISFSIDKLYNIYENAKNYLYN